MHMADRNANEHSMSSTKQHHIYYYYISIIDEKGKLKENIMIIIQLKNICFHKKHIFFIFHSFNVHGDGR